MKIVTAALKNSVAAVRNDSVAATARYRPDIDGMRSIAVTAVIIFHLRHGFLPGGFVGVDVFFVISGYLITGMLIADMDHGDFLLRFYQRRIARIVPVMLLVTLAATIGGKYVYSRQDFASLGANDMAAVASIINIKLLSQGDYFTLSPDAQPFLHYWSLAVEEQFYMIFPAMLYVVWRLPMRPLSSIIALCAASFLACAVLTKWAPTYAFYLLPTRAWELLAGSALAIRRCEGCSLDARSAAFAAPVGLITLAAAFVFVKEGDRFPGWGAAVPVLGAALLLASAHPEGTIGKALSHPAPVFVGKRSYSLYLWHWPVFSMVDYHCFAASGATRAILKIGITVAATLATYRWIERPLRSYLNARQRRAIAFSGFALTAATIGAAGYEIHSNNYFNAEPAQIARGGIVVNAGGQDSVVLIGDSQGSMYGEDLARLAREAGFRLNVLSVAGGSELPEEPGTYWPDVRRFVARDRPNVIVLAELWSAKFGGDSDRLSHALATVAGLADRVIVLAQPPIAPEQATREAIRNGARPPFFEKPRESEARARALGELEEAAVGDVAVLNIAPTLLNEDGSIRIISRDGNLNYHDATHLSDAGVSLVQAALDRAVVVALRNRDARGRGGPITAMPENR